MITVAGGTGIVGKSLTEARVSDRDRLRVLTRGPEGGPGRTRAELTPAH
jgi:NAD dependent epimerase/dehydratase family enzyme